MRWRDRRTTVGRAVTSLLLGAVIGAVLTAVGFAVGYPLGGESDPDDQWGMALFLLPFAAIVWAVGLFTIGGFGWWLLVRTGLKHPLSAAAYGAAAVGGTISLLMQGRLQWPYLTAWCLAGAVVAGFVWWRAYRPTGPKPEVFE